MPSSAPTPIFSIASEVTMQSIYYCTPSPLLPKAIEAIVILMDLKGQSCRILPCSVWPRVNIFRKTIFHILWVFCEIKIHFQSFFSFVEFERCFFQPGSWTTWSPASTKVSICERCFFQPRSWTTWSPTSTKVSICECCFFQPSSKFFLQVECHPVEQPEREGPLTYKQ